MLRALAAPAEAGAGHVLRMVTGMGPNKNENRDVTDWLAGGGGKWFAIVAVVLVAWGIASKVFG